MASREQVREAKSATSNRATSSCRALTPSMKLRLVYMAGCPAQMDHRSPGVKLQLSTMRTKARNYVWAAHAVRGHPVATSTIVRSVDGNSLLHFERETAR